MSLTLRAVGLLAQTLRAARKRRGLSIAQLAAMAAVSPRLISELERGMRANVSFETAARLADLVGVALTFESQPADADEAARRRAERRRQRWTGEQSTLSQHGPPPPPPVDAAERLTAVARASRLATGLQRAPRATAATRAATSTE